MFARKAKSLGEILAAAILCSLLSAAPAAAQVLYGSLVGDVRDASGAAIAGATVSVTQSQTQLNRKVVTDSSGHFTVSNLSPGDYDVRISAPGFKTFGQAHVPITLNNVTRVDAALEVGEVTQTVEVTGETPLLQTDRSDVRHDITADTIENVPLPPGNNFESLFKTLPGFTPPTTAHSIPTNPSRALQFNVNGTSEYGNDIRIDGVSQFNIWVPENAAYIPSSDAIEVVNAVTGTFNPEQGLAGGSTVNVQIKSGTNQFHGDLYEYHFNNKLEAHNFFDPNNGITRVPKDIFNQFGGSAGGPIKRDKLFFFSNVELTRQRQFATNVATAPTVAMMQGDLRGLDPANGLTGNPYIVYDPTTGNPDGTGRQQIYATANPADTAHYNPLCSSPQCLNMIPTSRISPVAQKLLTLLREKAPGRFLQSASTDAPSDNYLAATSFAFNRITTDEKIDWHANDKFTMFGHVGFLSYNDLDPQLFGEVGGPPISDYGGNEGKGDGHTLTLSVTGNYVATPNLVFDGNFGVTRMVTNSRMLDLDKNLGLDFLGIPGTNGTRRFEGSWPRFAISGFDDLGTHNTYMPYLRNDPQFYWSGNSTWIHGNHTVRFGGSIFILHLNHQQAEWNAGGSTQPGAGGFSFGSGPTACRDCADGKGSRTNAFNNFATFLLGLNTAYGKNILLPDYFHTRTHQYSLYAGDQWQATPKLTFNVGVRWEYFPIPTRDDRGLERYDFARNMMLLCGIGNVPTDCGVSISKNMFVPRVGLAYRVTPTFVIRAGYGITNEPYNLADDLRTNYPVLIPLYVTADSYKAAGVLDSASLQNAPPGSDLPVGIPLPETPDISSGEVPVLPNVALATTPEKLERGYIQSWNLTLEKEFGKGWVAQAGYVATRTIRQLGFLDLNVESPIRPAGCIPGSDAAECGGDESRPFYSSLYGFRTAATSLITPIANNHYDALQTKLTHRFQSGYQVQLAYTWSKTIGISGVSNEKNHPDIQTPEFYFLNRGLAPQDRPHNFQAVFVAQPPFGRGRRWATSGISSKILGGWQLSGIMSIVSGSVFRLTAGGTSTNNLNASGNAQRPDIVSSSVAVTGDIGPGTKWFDTSAFAVVEDRNRFGTSPFYLLHGPSLFELDGALTREFPITERFHLQFRAQAINLTNTPHFSNPNGDLNSSSFGRVNGLANTGRDGGVDARQLEFNMKLIF